MGRRGHSLCLDPGPPLSPGLRSSGARPTLPSLSAGQRLVFVSAWWRVAKWDSERKGPVSAELNSGGGQLIEPRVCLRASVLSSALFPESQGRARGPGSSA